MSGLGVGMAIAPHNHPAPLEAPRGNIVYVLTVGDYRALHSWGPFSSWQAAYDRLVELQLTSATWEIAPRVVDGPLSTLQAAQ